MKKITLFFFATVFATTCLFGQANIVTTAPVANTTTGIRAPNGSNLHSFMRGASLVLTSELNTVTSGTILNTFGFSTSTGASSAVTGTIVVYMLNTSDATFTRGTSWATIIAGMTQVYSGPYTVPASATNIDLTLSTPFTYTGGGIYVAYDFVRTGTAATTGAVYNANSTGLTGGCVSANSDTAAPTTLASTSFRPATRFGYVNTNSNDVAVEGVSSFGNIATTLGLAAPISAIVRNKSNVALTNIIVTAAISGANTYSNSQTIPTLAAGASVTVNFTSWTPTALGSNVLNVSVPADQVNTNNNFNFNTSSTCFVSGQGQSGVSYSSGVGFNTGSGIISTPILNSVSSTIAGVNVAISSESATAINVGNTVFGVLLSSTGAILAQSPNAVLVAGDLNTIKTFTFPNAIAIAANQQVHVGLGQTANTTAGYFPLGSYGNPNLTTVYNTSALTGGTLTLLTTNLGQLGIEAVFSGSCALLGTDSFMTSSFTVYPNPARNLVSVEGSNDANIVSYKIADLNGRIVKSVETINSTSVQINISDLQSGVYMMTINSDKGSVVKKIIKE
jgi:hypothetical protein